MSPVSSSVPVGSARQDDILTRDRQPRDPRGKFTTSANKDAHTYSCVYMHTEGLFKWPGCNADRALPMHRSQLHHLSGGADNTKSTGGEVTGDRSAKSSSHCVPVHKWWETDQEEIQHVVGISSHSWIYTVEFFKYSSGEKKTKQLQSCYDVGFLRTRGSCRC